MSHYTRAAFDRLCDRRVLFCAHLAKEGIPLFEGRDLLKRAETSLVDPNTDDGLTAARRRLRLYDDLDRYGDDLTFVLFHVYVVGASIAMNRLARRGIFEFRREAAFERLAAVEPQHRDAVTSIRQLRPFYATVRRRMPQELPFQPTDRSASRAVITATAGLASGVDP